MSVRDVDVIDYVGINVLFKRVYVGIFDELDWLDEAKHIDLLTRKLDRCIRHIRLGQLLLNYPTVRGYEVVIEYVSTHPMTQSAREYWQTREELIRAAGYGVRARGVDVRPALGIEVEVPVEPEPIEAFEVLDALETQPLRPIAEAVDIAYLTQPAQPAPKRALPVLARLAARRAAV